MEERTLENSSSAFKIVLHNQLLNLLLNLDLEPSYKTRACKEMIDSTMKGRYKFPDLVAVKHSELLLQALRFLP